jgi:hypothetical protein
MSMQHTPGPWEVVGGEDDAPDICAGGGVIATMRSWAPTKAQRDSLTQELFANARLLAAAPELLGHLRFAVKLLGAMPAIGSTAQVNAMRAAIAKVTGEQA